MQAEKPEVTQEASRGKGCKMEACHLAETQAAFWMYLLHVYVLELQALLGTILVD